MDPVLLLVALLWSPLGGLLLAGALYAVYSGVWVVPAAIVVGTVREWLGLDPPTRKPE